MRHWGTLARGPNAYALAANAKIAARFVVVDDGRVSALSVWADGLGAGGGDQPVRPVVYDNADLSLVAAGDELVIPAGSEAQRFSATFWGAHPGGVALPAGEYLFGLHSGPPAGARVFGNPAGPLGGLSRADTYADGPSDPFGAGAETGHDLSLFAPWFSAYALPDETEEWYARHPFGLAEALFLQEGTKPGTVLAPCTWHGTHVDPESGAFAIVRDDGPLADLVGQRLLVSVGSSVGRTRRVAVFCHSMGPVDGADISLTRRAFAQISGLAVGDSIPVAVEVLG